MGKQGKTHGRYGRFWGLIQGKPHLDKEELVLQFTDGRTTRLHEMKDAEYEEMCDCIAERDLADRNSYREKVRKARSSVLKRVGKLGINTIDNWDEVNAFLASPKIAGKYLYEMSLDELNDLIRKLEAILRKGGLRNFREDESNKAREDLNRMMTSISTTTTSQKYLS